MLSLSSLSFSNSSFRAGLASEIVTLAFGAVIVGLALAAALAFGLGGREEAAKAIADWRSRS